MSEFQYVGFRAVDAPLTDKQLDYMERQSSRADITRHSFDNTYHYSDFRGNTAEMLRRGYDVHLHYANFGIRTLMIRFPHGLPVAKSQRSKYIDGENVQWKADSKGRAGILSISAPTEPGMLGELWDLHEYLDNVVGVRQQLIDGDLRPLYAAWMCGCQSDEVNSDEAVEPPVPAGLEAPPEAVAAMLEFFDLGTLMLAAAAEKSPPAPAANTHDAIAQWLETLDAGEMRQWMLQILTGETAAVRSECLQKFRKAHNAPSWPTVKGGRTFSQIADRAAELEKVERAREEKRQQRARRKRLADMARSPQEYLKQADQQVEIRGRDAYDQAAQILSDLREAIGGDEGEKITRRHAAHLKKKHPTLKMLSGALKRQGLLS